MKLLICAILLVVPVAAEWQRHILTPKGLRDYDNDFCYPCSPEKRLAVARRSRDRPKVRLVGIIQGFPIYDILYYFGEELTPDWKSILVKEQPGRYREILHYQRNEGGIWPSYLVKAGEETLLGLEDDCYRADTIQEYYWFDKNGPVRVDFSPIWKAADAVPPKDIRAEHDYDGRIDIPAGRVRMGVSREPEGRCCSHQGIVEVEFRLKGGRVVVTGTSFDPIAEFTDVHRCR